VAKNARYCTKFRRRIEGKTDYKARRALIVSGKPRLVTRTSINNIIAQVIAAKPKGDEVLISAHSRELMKYGWKVPRGNVPTAYLTGYLCGLKAKAAGVEEAIFDIGLYRPKKGARIFAVLKGVLDAKVNVPHSVDKFPDEKRLKGEHIASYAQALAAEPEEYRSKFSKYLQQDVKPEALPKHFEQVKSDMHVAFKNRGK
jgi:large subunit ribosomal protein L18